MRRFGIAAGLVLALLAAPGTGAAEEPYALELYNGLMSPYCPGRTLMDCPSGQAGELRDWIAAQERAGRSRQEVEAELYAQYGDVILQAPRAEGFGLAAYVLPVVAFLIGGAIVWVFLRRQAAASAAAPRGPALRVPIDAELERRIDEELRA